MPITKMLTAEANYLGAHFAHIVARDDFLRLERIEQATVGNRRRRVR